MIVNNSSLEIINMIFEINPEIICSIADKARQFQVKEAVVIPENQMSHGDYSQYQILEDYQDDPTYCEFMAMVNDLEPDQQDVLVALMWVGRGDFNIEDWEVAKEQAHDSRSVPVALYLIMTPLLADFLEEGLSKFGYTCNE
jgi:hypothetical protein